MPPVPGPLQMFGGPPPPGEVLDWGWAVERLADADFYWVTPSGGAHPHPRPVWAVWGDDERLHLSLGSPVIKRLAAANPAVTVHVGDGSEVVVVEGAVAGPTSSPAVIAAYDRKYDWSYDVEQYGPFTTVIPVRVLAWQASGPAGRDGFTATGRWAFDG